MLLLALDTSTSAVTVALHDGSAVLADATVLDARAHAEHLAPLVRRTLVEAGAQPRDVTHVVAGTGPGPFTGLRVGLVTARAFALAADARLLGCCSLDALAHEAWAAAQDGRLGDADLSGGLLVATDARRKEVYWAHYVPQQPDGEPSPLLERVAGPDVSRAADLPEDLRALPTVGRGAGLYPEALPCGVGPLDVDAAALADLAARRLAARRLAAGEQLDDPDDVQPLYLRRPDAKPAAPKPVTLPPVSGRRR